MADKLISNQSPLLGRMIELVLSCRLFMAVCRVRWRGTSVWIWASVACRWQRNRDASSALALVLPCFVSQNSSGHPCISAFSLTCCSPWKVTYICGGGMRVYGLQKWQTKTCSWVNVLSWSWKNFPDPQTLSVKSDWLKRMLFQDQ